MTEESIIERIKENAYKGELPNGQAVYELTDGDLRITAKCLVKKLNLARVSNSLVADIRNKLTPPNNLCAMLKDRDVDPFIGDDPRNKMIDDEIEQTLKSIDYLSNL